MTLAVCWVHAAGPAGVPQQRLHERRGLGPRLHHEQEDQERTAGAVQLHPGSVATPPLFTRHRSLAGLLHIDCSVLLRVFQWWERRRGRATPWTCAPAITKCTASARWRSASSAWSNSSAAGVAMPRRSSESSSQCGDFWVKAHRGLVSPPGNRTIHIQYSFSYFPGCLVTPSLPFWLSGLVVCNSPSNGRFKWWFCYSPTVCIMTCVCVDSFCRELYEIYNFNN